MNLAEAVELLSVVSAIPVKNPLKSPEICIFFNQGEGYTLRIKRHLVNADYRKHLDEIVESRKLGFRESKRYLIIYGNSDYPLCSL
jgi:hypothetical protein